MRKQRWIISLFVLVMCIVPLQANEQKDAEKFKVEQVPEQVVLYTIYRGDYANFGPAIGQLYSVAMQNGMEIRGNIRIAYLNNPKNVAKEHWLAEIRIPVSEKALEKAGTLGGMTDVKKMTAKTVTTAIKPSGIKDPSLIVEELLTWIATQGYRIMDNPEETILENAQTGDYTQMKSKLCFPVTK